MWFPPCKYKDARIMVVSFTPRYSGKGTSPWCMWFPSCNYKDARAPKLSSGHLQPSMETAQVSPTTVSFSENILSLNTSWIFEVLNRKMFRSSSQWCLWYLAWPFSWTRWRKYLVHSDNKNDPGTSGDWSRCWGKCHWLTCWLPGYPHQVAPRQMGFSENENLARQTWSLLIGFWN